jgi:uncharacterized RDD family membrane protein YckC
MLVPLYLTYAAADYLPEPFHRLSIVGIPLAIIYVIFRDSFGKGTSLGKRVLGLVIVDLRTGQPCNWRRVLARNVIDPIPVVDLLDFLLTCLDERGQKIMDKVLETQVTEGVGHLTPGERVKGEAKTSTPERGWRE